MTKENRIAMYEFQIGEGDPGDGAVPKKSSGKIVIHENDACYWISECVLNLSGFIIKGTRASSKLANLLDRGKNPDCFLNDLSLNKTPNRIIIKSVDKAMERSYNSGRANVKRNLKELLGM